MELSPAVCVIAVELSGKLTPVESKDNVNDWPEATVVISFVVPPIANICESKSIWPEPVSPVKSKSSIVIWAAT